MRANNTVYLFDITEVQNPNTGIIEKQVQTITKLQAEVSPVGSNTFWQSSSENIQLLYSVQINARMYRKQKYIGFRDYEGFRVYQIHNVGKGEALHLLKLNVKSTEEALEELVADAI